MPTYKKLKSGKIMLRRSSQDEKSKETMFVAANTKQENLAEAENSAPEKTPEKLKFTFPERKKEK